MTSSTAPAMPTRTAPLRRAARLLAAVLAVAAALPLLYLLAGLGLALVPVEGEAAPADDGIAVFVTSNGVHTDLLLPVAAGGVDWLALLPLDNLRDPHIAPTHVGFGWGDRAFYLETRRWADLRPATAWSALFGGGGTVMHVGYHGPPRPGPHTRRVVLDAEGYARLARHLAASLARDGAGRPVAVPGGGYGPHDAFYEAVGAYGVLLTCNEWTSRALAEAGVRTALWTPFTFGVMHHLPAP